MVSFIVKPIPMPLNGNHRWCVLAHFPDGTREVVNYFETRTEARAAAHQYRNDILDHNILVFLTGEDLPII